MPTGTNWYFFNTPEDARRVTQASTALQAHRFEVTHYNHDPDTTFFNEPRIVLTTRPDRAGWTFTNSQWVGKNGLSGTSGRPYYIRILKDEGNASNIPLKRPSQHSPALSDPGTMAALDTVLNGKVDDTIRFLIGYLQRTDWPMVSPANSIQSKYYTKSYAENYPAGYSTKRLAQLAVNIIDYVRSKESELDLVEPLRTAEDSIANPGHYISGSNAGNSIYGPLAYIGQTRAPRITEVGCWFDTDNITHKYKVEVYLPRNYGLNSISFNNIYLQIQWLNSGNGAGYADEFFGGQNRPLASSLSPVPATLSAGGYVTLTFPSTTKYYVPLTTGLGNATTPLPAPRPSFVDARFSLWSWWGTAYVMYGASALSIGGKAYQVYDRTTNAWIPGNNTNTWIHCPVDPVATPENGITSVEVDDPRLNLSMNNWVARALGSGNTFGAVNSISALNAPGNPTVPAGEPQQDTDAAGTTISTASLYMPPPAGKTFTLSSGVVDDNTLGMVLSAGELGYIHTGIESSSYVFNTLNNTTVTGTIPKGVPWRTLRLQPNRDGTNVVPDWAFMDLFSAPVFAPTGAEYVYSPGAKDTTGRAKTVGGRVNLNCKPTFPDIDRTQPLAAVLQGSTYSSTNTATLSPTQAATLAGNIYHGTLATGGKQYGYVDGYDSPGEIVEIQGIADQGEASEELVRKIANLITTRGNVFSVYSIGQALKQTPTGGLTVVGEQRLQAMIERIEYTESAVKKVRFSPVYYRNLTP